MASIGRRRRPQTEPVPSKTIWLRRPPQAYADFYENKYRHRSIPYAGEPPDRETLSAEFMARDHRWADFLTNCGGFEIRKTKRVKPGHRRRDRRHPEPPPGSRNKPT